MLLSDICWRKKSKYDVLLLPLSKLIHYCVWLCSCQRNLWRSSTMYLWHWGSPDVSPVLPDLCFGSWWSGSATK